MLSHFLRAATIKQGGGGTIEYVGGYSFGFAGQSTDRTVSYLNALTGGIASTPSAGDLIIVGFATASTINRSLVINGYTEIADLFSSDTNDTNLEVGYKFNAGETSFVLTGGTQSATDGGTITIQVFRNVDSSNPFDVTTTTATGTSSGRARPPAITPSTSGSIILCIGANASAKGTSTFTASELSNFVQGFGSDTYDSLQGAGTYTWVSGTFTPSAWTWSAGVDSAASWAAVTIALKPA